MYSLGVEHLGVQPLPTWGASPFIVQGGAPCLHISIVVSWFHSGGLSSSSVVGAHPVGREWTLERLESGWFFWATGCLAAVPPWSVPGFATWAVARRLSPILSVRSAAARPSLRGFCPKDGTPVEGCSTMVKRCCPVTLCWRNGVVCRGSHHYSAGGGAR